MEAGANQRVTTDSGIVLDFAGLFGDSVEQKRPSKTPLETILDGEQYKTIAYKARAESRNSSPLFLYSPKSALTHHPEGG